LDTFNPTARLVDDLAESVQCPRIQFSKNAMGYPAIVIEDFDFELVQETDLFRVVADFLGLGLLAGPPVFAGSVMQEVLNEHHHLFG
jgi:hypothetical protein